MWWYQLSHLIWLYCTTFNRPHQPDTGFIWPIRGFSHLLLNFHSAPSQPLIKGVTAMPLGHRNKLLKSSWSSEYQRCFSRSKQEACHVHRCSCGGEERRLLLCFPFGDDTNAKSHEAEPGMAAGSRVLIERSRLADSCKEIAAFLCTTGHRGVQSCSHHCCPLQSCTHLLLNDEDAARSADKDIMSCCIAKFPN